MFSGNSGDGETTEDHRGSAIVVYSMSFQRVNTDKGLGVSLMDFLVADRICTTESVTLAHVYRWDNVRRIMGAEYSVIINAAGQR